MILPGILRQLPGDRRGTTMVELALVGGMTMLTTLGILDLGMLLWAQNALQSTAALAARCAAIGSATLCPNVKTYAVNLANSWTIPNMISANDVTVTQVTSCNTANGSFKQVTISTAFWANVLPPPFHNQALSASACYPTL
jgi:Flp pilus assembly protein TadG